MAGKRIRRPKRKAAAPISAFKQFLRFGVVGAAGFVVDAGTLWAVRLLWGLDPYSARVLSYLAAATATWALNRRYTFVGADRRGALGQWLRFLFANLGGGAVNYLTYALLISSTSLPDLPAGLGLTVAVGAGSLAGLLVNFVASRQLVFKGLTSQSRP